MVPRPFSRQGSAVSGTFRDVLACLSLTARAGRVEARSSTQHTYLTYAVRYPTGGKMQYSVGLIDWTISMWMCSRKV